MKFTKTRYLIFAFTITFISLSQFNLEANLIDEIVVTASKNDSKILTTQGNISLIGSEEIKFLGSRNPSEILNRLPGIYISQGSGQEHLTSIRSPVLSGGAGAGSFLFLEDGIPLRSPGFGNVNGLMESIIEIGEKSEVIRGPGSTLYGSNAIHGLMNVITPKPSDIKSGSIGTHFSKSDFIINGDYSIPTENGGFLLGLYWREDNGNSNNNSGEKEEDKTDQPHYGQQKFLFRLDHSKNLTDYIFTFSGTNLNQETMGYVKGFEIYENKEISKTNPDPEAFRDTYSIRSALKIIKNLKDATLSITPFIRYNDMSFKMHFLPGKPLEKNSHKSIGLQTLYTKEIKNLNLYLGGDIELTEGKLSEFQDAPDVSFGPRLAYPKGAHYDYSVDSRILSIYINTEWEINPKTILTAGIRAENTEYDYKTNIQDGTRGRIQVTPNRSDDYTDISIKTAISYLLNDKNALFANFSRGNRAPQVTDLYRIQSKQIPGGAKSEKLDSFEIGFRGSINNLQYEIVGYKMEKDNFFFRDSQGFNVENGKTDHEGIELNYILSLGENLEISGSSSLADHKYKFDHTPNGIKNGNTIDSAPEKLANTRISYLFSDDGKIEAEWIKVGGYPIDGRNAHFYNGHDIFNLRIQLSISETSNFAFKVANLTDERYATRADFAFGSYRYFVGDEREFHFSFNKDF